MFIKGTVVCTDRSCYSGVDVEIDENQEKGSIYTQDYEMTYKVKTIKDVENNITYYVDVYKCTFGRGCRFKILDILGE